MLRSEYILHIVEARQLRTLYFGSSEQGLSGELTPRLPKSAHRTGARLLPTLYGTNDKSYAAGFTFDWVEQQGLGFGKYGRKGHYILTIPYSQLRRLRAPCSIYTIEGYFSRLRTSTPEYVTHSPARILHEEKYTSIEDCLHQNNVLVHVVQVAKG